MIVIFKSIFGKEERAYFEMECWAREYVKELLKNKLVEYARIREENEYVR